MPHEARTCASYSLNISEQSTVRSFGSSAPRRALIASFSDHVESTRYVFGPDLGTHSSWGLRSNPPWRTGPTSSRVASIAALSGLTLVAGNNCIVPTPVSSTAPKRSEDEAERATYPLSSQRLHRHAVLPHFKMKMRPCRITGCAYATDNGALLHALPFANSE